MLKVQSSSVSLTMHVPSAAAWRVLTDVKHAGTTLTHVASLDLLTSGPFREGTSWRETRRALGGASTRTMTVRDIVPGHGYQATGQIGEATCQLAYHLVGRGEETTVISNLEIVAPLPRSVARRALVVLRGTRTGRVFRRQLAADLVDIERAAQRVSPS